MLYMVPIKRTFETNSIMLLMIIVNVEGKKQKLGFLFDRIKIG